jgi:thiosulfate/3-mercaptopyruvate sulfurtransferase
VKIDWHADLNDPLQRDYLDAEQFAALMRRKGIAPDTTVVFYGDKNNWWATYALWVFQLFGHDRVRIMDGGRKKWEDEGRPMTTDEPVLPPVDYPAPVRDDAAIRAFRDDVMRHIDGRGGRWSTSAARRSTAASVCTCRTTRRKARCAAATSPARTACPGPGR